LYRPRQGSLDETLFACYSDPEYEADRVMKVVPLQHTRLRCVVPVLTLAAAYAIAAWLGLWLAIPPGRACNRGLC